MPPAPLGWYFFSSFLFFLRRPRFSEKKCLDQKTYLAKVAWSAPKPRDKLAARLVYSSANNQYSVQQPDVYQCSVAKILYQCNCLDTIISAQHSLNISLFRVYPVHFVIIH